MSDAAALDEIWRLMNEGSTDTVEDAAELFAAVSRALRHAGRLVAGDLP